MIVGTACQVLQLVCSHGSRAQRINLPARALMLEKIGDLASAAHPGSLARTPSRTTVFQAWSKAGDVGDMGRSPRLDSVVVIVVVVVVGSLVKSPSREAERMKTHAVITDGGRGVEQGEGEVQRKVRRGIMAGILSMQALGLGAIPRGRWKLPSDPRRTRKALASSLYLRSFHGRDDVECIPLSCVQISHK